MSSALYYPFTSPVREPLLKSALFLWDKVDFIVPHHNFARNSGSRYKDEALEIIGRNYVPTDRDKSGLHEEMKKVCNGPLAQTLRVRPEDQSPRLGFHPEKLGDLTWEMLADAGLVDFFPGGEASTSSLLGCYMMVTFAVCCSQGVKTLVTDQIRSYEALAELIAEAPFSQDRQAEVESPLLDRDWHSRLVALTLGGPDFSKISLQRLVNLRKKEDQLLYEQRRAFLKKVEEAVADITASSGNPNLIRDRIEAFASDMERELKELKRALRLSVRSLILSKEFGVSVMAAVGAFVSDHPAASVSGGILPVYELAKGWTGYRDRRREILKKNAASWLLTAGGPRMPLV